MQFTFGTYCSLIDKWILHMCVHIKCRAVLHLQVQPDLTARLQNVFNLRSHFGSDLQFLREQLPGNFVRLN